MEMIGGLTVTPHPLTLANQRHIPSDLIPGETLHAFLSRHVDNIDSGTWIVTIGGYEVPPALWNKTKPRHGTVIECRSIVRKGFVQLIAIVALSYFTLGAGGLAAGTATTSAGLFAAGGAIGGGFLAASATFIAGSMLINKVLGPKPATGLGGGGASPTYSLSGGRNRARPYEPIALLFGEMRVSPDFGAVPYTFFEGEDQYLYSVFHGGINCASVRDIRIGKTSLGSYTGVTTRASGFSGMTEQALDGWGNVDSIAGALLSYDPEPLTVTRTSSANTIALQVDFDATLHYHTTTKGKFVENPAWITGEYRLLPSGGWMPFFLPSDPFYDSSAVVRLVSGTTQPVRQTYTRYVPAGQYEVRMTKTHPIDHPDQSNNVNIVNWTQLKSIQADTGTYGGMGRLGLKIKASGQLNGALDEVNWLATAKPMPYWNGSAWVTATSRDNGLSNPGAQMLQYMRGIYDNAGKLIAGMGLSDSQIDLESLKAFMIWCASNNFTFDYVFDSPISHGDVLDAMAAVGFGSHTWQGGKLGVSWAANDQPIEGVVNMATMKARTFGLNYQTLETADGLEYAYYDRDQDYKWKTLRVADPNVVTPLNPARVTSMGVTEEAHAAILARFHLAQSLYQRKDIQYEADLEHLTYKRNSVLAVTHDVTQWGYGGRLQNVVNNDGILTLTLDDVVPAGTGARYIGLRVPGERGYRVFGVAAFEGDSREVTLTETWPVGVAVPGSTGNPVSDTIWIYDFKETPGYRVRVVGIKPQAGLKGATISVVPDSAEFWDYVFNGTYVPPVSQSLLPGLPTASAIQFSEDLQRQGNTFYVDLTATFSISGSYEKSEIWGATAGNPLAKLGDTTGIRFTWRGALDDVWTIEVRPFDRLGRPGTVAIGTYTVRGLSVPPENYDTFTISFQPDGTRQFEFAYTTTEAPDDLAGPLIRYKQGSETEPDWDTMTDLNSPEPPYPSSPYETNLLLSGDHVFALKAVDTTGNVSEVPLYIYATLPDRRLGNVLDEFYEHDEGWQGVLTDCHITAAGIIEANNADTWASHSTWAGWTRWNSSPASPITYETPVRDLGIVVTGGIDSAMDAEGSATIEMRTSEDNVTWSAYSSAGGLFQARYLQVRATVEAATNEPIPRIKSWTVQVQADVISETINDADISTYTGAHRIGIGDVRIPVANTYGIIKRISAAIQDSTDTSWTWVIIDKDVAGPRVQFRANGTLADPALVDFYIEGS